MVIELSFKWLGINSVPYPVHQYNNSGMEHPPPPPNVAVLTSL
jgi:hypothetical protein